MRKDLTENEWQRYTSNGFVLTDYNGHVCELNEYGGALLLVNVFVSLTLLLHANQATQYNGNAGQAWVRREHLKLISRIRIANQVEVVKGPHQERRVTVISNVDMNGMVEIGSYSMTGEKKVRSHC